MRIKTHLEVKIGEWSAWAELDSYRLSALRTNTVTLNVDWPWSTAACGDSDAVGSNWWQMPRSCV